VVLTGGTIKAVVKLTAASATNNLVVAVVVVIKVLQSCLRYDFVVAQLREEAGEHVFSIYALVNPA
jgi:hypothetical protein